MDKTVLPEFVGLDFKNHFVENLLDTDYHADKSSISSSGLKEMRESPNHFYAKWTREVESTDTDALKIGRLVHLAILEGGRFHEKRTVMPEFGDMRSPKNREVRDKWLADLPKDMIVLDKDDMATVSGCVVSLSKNDKALKILQEGIAEVSGFWREPHTGLKCRIRPDFIRLKDNWLVDFKTAQDSSMRAFQNSVIKYGYDMQMAFYFDGIEKISGRAPEGAAWVVMEKKPPYDVSVYVLDGVTLEEGRRLYKYNMAKLARCLKENKWPGRNDGKVTDFIYPTWKLRQLENGEGLEGWGTDVFAE